MMKQVTSLVLAAGLALAAVPGGAQVSFDPNTVWGSVPQGVSEAANAVLLDVAGKTVATVPIADGKFVFRDVSPGQYVVTLHTGLGRELARSLTATLTTGSVEAIFGRDRVPAAVVPSHGGLSRTGWILIGAAAVGITTAAIIIAHDDNVASPSR